MRCLNLYSGIGGNRRAWPSHAQVTAVEYDPIIAQVYSDRFPDDEMVVGDAHGFLLENYKDFDFIWSSPPCPSHSQFRFFIGHKGRGLKAIYPDMKLYEEIIFLQHYFKGLYVVENTRPYYEPLIKPQMMGRHYLWANFTITEINIPPSEIADRNTIREMEEKTGIDLGKYKMKNKRQILRNCVDSELGEHIFNCAEGHCIIKKGEDVKQVALI